MKIRSFEDVSKYMEKNRLKADEQSSYSLERVEDFLSKIGNPQDKIRTVHVAGTSGKTSTCYYLAELLSMNGYKTGLTVSPHLECINERVQVDGAPVEEKEFCRNLEEFIRIVRSFNIQLTYFEFFTSFAFWYFAKVKVDFAVVEVGIGGLLDATNTINSPDKICVITDIGLDHISMLGNTIEKIAAQKAGIIKPGNSVFCNKQRKKVMDCIKTTAEAKDAELFINPDEDFGSFRERNFSLAKYTASAIFKKDSRSMLSKDKLNEAASLTVPGRMEKYKIGDKVVVLDGAHNAQKVEGFLDSIKDEVNREDTCFVVSLGENKKNHLLEISQAISKYANHVILTEFSAKQDFRRESLTAGYLKSYFEDVSSEKVFDLDKAVEKAFVRPEKTIIFTGSLYMVGPVRTKLQELMAR